LFYGKSGPHLKLETALVVEMLLFSRRKFYEWHLKGVAAASGYRASAADPPEAEENGVDKTKPPEFTKTCWKSTLVDALLL